jgi:type III pantothenate kinase
MAKIDSKKPNKILFLDVGNTAVKGAFRKGLKWEAVHSKKISSASDMVFWLKDHANAFDEIVICSVREDVKEAIIETADEVNFTVLSNKDIPRDLLDYETPETLGLDRFLACYGAIAQTEKSVVVIDSGTALTIDFMDRDEVFHGGLIVPGIQGFSELLPHKAPALPKVDLDIPKEWPGKSTRESLQWGQAGFYQFAIHGVLEKFRQEFGDFELFLTGGDAPIIEKLLKDETKVRSFLIFEGMERLSLSQFQGQNLS